MHAKNESEIRFLNCDNTFVIKCAQ